MKRVRGLAVSKMLLATLGVSVLVAGTAQAQSDLTTFTGKFTLTNQVQWGTNVLQPGDYTISLGSSNGMTFTLVRDSKGRGIGRFVSSFDEGSRAGAGNALRIRDKGGRPCVYSLALASLRKVLVYDPVLEREAVMEARAPQTVPVMLAKR